MVDIVKIDSSCEPIFALRSLFVYEENIQENKYQGIIPTIE